MAETIKFVHKKSRNIVVKEKIAVTSIFSFANTVY